jgi:hypothetical protein
MNDEKQTGGLTTIDRGGRPVIFDEQMKADFLEQLASGLSNGEACGKIGISRPALHWHLSRDPEFREQYEIAKAAAVDALIDRAEEVAESAVNAETGAQVAGAKVLVDHLWRKASRIAPHRWGERPSVAVVVNDVMSEQEMAKRVAFLEALRGEEEVS